MADKQKIRTLGDMTPSELVRAARDELAGLVELARKLNGNYGPDETASNELYIGAYHGSIGSKLAVAESKLEEEPTERTTVAVGERVTARHVREFHQDYADDGAAFVQGLDGDDELSAFDILASTFADNSVFERVA
jgi:hypothetical protein